MRLSDTIFLTLTICLLQVYIGMRCLYEVRSQNFTFQQSFQTIDPCPWLFRRCGVTMYRQSIPACQWHFVPIALNHAGEQLHVHTDCRQL